MNNLLSFLDFIAETESAVPTNAVGASGMGSTSAGPIQGYDPLLKNKKKKPS